MAKKFGTDVENFYISFSDMMSLLLILFVYLFSISELEPIQYAQGAESIREQFTSEKQTGVLDALNIEIEKLRQMKLEIDGLILKFGLGHIVRVEYTNYQLELNLGESVLFELGKADLKPEALKIMGEIGKLLAISGSKIIVEGHTDNLPIHSKEFPSNWELSSARAASVVRFMESAGLSSDRFTVMGKADQAPLVPNVTPENRAQNRRVTVILRPDMEKIRVRTGQTQEKKKAH